MNGSPQVRRFVCNTCGHSHVAWAARCASCFKHGMTLSLDPAPPESAPPAKFVHAPQEKLPAVSRLRLVRAPSPDISPEELIDDEPLPNTPPPIPITDIEETEHDRYSTGLAPLDHVLGGGLVRGSIVLLASPPGIGKSSISLQMLAGIGHRCLYVTGEETREQIAGTARRVDAWTSQLFVLCESDLTTIFAHARAMKAQTIVIDSIQKMRSDDVNGQPGSPGQLKQCTARLVTFGKSNGITMWLIGHVTGDGDIAGPKTVEHDVDVVLELSQGTKFDGKERILRCPNKNRFGPTDDKATGYFELTATGLRPIDLDGWDEKL